jgi:hypothetical protein
MWINDLGIGHAYIACVVVVNDGQEAVRPHPILWSAVVGLQVRAV